MSIEKTGRLHQLKTWPEYFEAVADGTKPFEIRKNDRGFGVGDRLALREWQPETEEYTGRFAVAHVTYVLHGFGLQPGWCVMGIWLVEDENDCVVFGGEEV